MDEKVKTEDVQSICFLTMKLRIEDNSCPLSTELDRTVFHDYHPLNKHEPLPFGVKPSKLH